MKNLILPVLALLISTSAFAQNVDQRRLIDQNDRPSPSLILSNPQYTADFPHTSSFDSGAFLRDIPTLIVGLEKAFPGAKYAFLGRDMDLIADTVEAYYLSIGQTDRIARIRISTPSLQGVDLTLVTDFLIQQGLDAEPQAKKPPLIMVDYTSFNTNSQSTIITNSVTKGLLQRGVPPAEVLKRFNVATIHSGIYVDTLDTDNLSKDELANALKEQSKHFAQSKIVQSIVRIPIDNIAYNSEWHDKYGRLTLNGDKVTTTPLGYYDVYHKTPVLKDMISAIKLAKEPSFIQAIAELEKQHGVKIARGPTPPPPKPLTEKELAAIKAAAEKKLIADFKAELKQLSDQLSVQGAGVEYDKHKTSAGTMKLTPNGLILFQALQNSAYFEVPKYLEMSLDTMTSAYFDGKIGARDFRRIFIAILENKQITNPAIVKAIQKSYQQVLPLEIALGKMDVREKYLELSGVAGDNYKMLVNGGAMPLSCKFLFLNQ